jgi:hypothetical protein
VGVQLRVLINANQQAETLLKAKGEAAKALSEVISALESLEIDSFHKSSRSTDKVKAQLKSALAGWRSEIVDPRFPTKNSSLKTAHLKVTLRKETESVNGLALGQVSLDLCMNNRESMASHLLKLEIANSLASQPQKSLGIAVVLSEKMIQAGWDDSVGSDIEYGHALNKTYTQFLRTPIVLVVLAG